MRGPQEEYEKTIELRVKKSENTWRPYLIASPFFSLIGAWVIGPYDFSTTIGVIVFLVFWAVFWAVFLVPYFIGTVGKEMATEAVELVSDTIETVGSSSTAKKARSLNKERSERNAFYKEKRKKDKEKEEEEFRKWKKGKRVGAKRHFLEALTLFWERIKSLNTSQIY